MNISVKPTDTRVDEWDLAEIRGGGVWGDPFQKPQVKYMCKNRSQITQKHQF